MYWHFRTWLYIVCLVSLFLIVIIRLGEVQLWQGKEYFEQAENNRFYSLKQLADRGVLLDRFGIPLVRNERRFVEVVSPQSLYSRTIPVERDTAMQLLATDSAKIQLQAVRSYPFGEALAHVVGYVGKVDAEALKKNPQLDPAQWLGKLGLERVLNQQLMGRDGNETFEINSQVAKQRLVSQIEPEAGQDAGTTLDGALSVVARLALGSNRGSVVILDADTGNLVSLVNAPSFAPTVMSQPEADETKENFRRQQILTWSQDQNQPFFNRAVSGSYPPGSIFKLVTALAGLESGAVTPDSEVDDQGTLKVGDYEYGNWYFRQYGRKEGLIHLVRAIARSNDIFFYKAAEWTGPDKIAQMARLLGFGSATGIEIGGEAKGLVPDPQWKEKNLGERWFLGNTYHLGIGQGDLLVTPLQIAQLIQIIAHNGVLCRPSVLLNRTADCHSVGIQEDHLKMVLAGMLDACSPSGTAFPFFPLNQSRRQPDATPTQDLQRGAVACKTGTAEFGGADARGYRKTHGWWAGIVEPQIPELTLAGGQGNSQSGSDLNTAPLAASSSVASSSGSISGLSDRWQWGKLVQEHRYPRRLAIVVLLESDDDHPYREGSRDAGAIAKQILDWMEGRAAKTN